MLSKRAKAGLWKKRIDAAGKVFEKWEARSEKIIKRYRDEREGGGATGDKRRRFNILWSNVQTLTPALYGRAAKPEVSRRFKDQDPVGRTAATMLERALEYEVEQYPDFADAMRNSVEDRLLPGRGSAWVRYEAKVEGAPGASGQVSEDKKKNAPAEVTQQVTYECAPTDYVNWRDFLHSPARTWEEVWWVARSVWLTKDEGVKRFGDIFNSVPLTTEDKQKTGTAEALPTESQEQKAKIWEIWDKSSGYVYWVPNDYSVCLDERPDPLKLEMFFPCPKPLYATTTTGTLVPVPDYVEYQDQAEELDTLTQRIHLLVRALKAVGIYNAEYKELQRLLNEGMDNQMIPVSSWAAFAEKGGLKGAVDFLPLDTVIAVLQGLYESRESCKQIIYELTGISDIIRGASKASETATAQQIKSNYAGLRLRHAQQDVARYASDLLRMKAQIICTHYAAETILAMSGVEYTDDAQYAPQALQLLKSGNMKDFRIQVQADSLAQLDDMQEKQDRVEFLQAVGGFMEQAAKLGTNPAVVSLMGSLLKFGVRGFKVGRDVEGAIEKAVDQLTQQAEQAAQQPPPPDPKLQAEQIKAQAAGQTAQANVAVANARTQQAQIEAQTAPVRAQAEIARANADSIDAQTALQRAAFEASLPPQRTQ